MSRDKDNPALTLLAFFYPFLSTLAPVLFFHFYDGYNFLFPWAFPAAHILLISGGILIFNPFCRKNLYAFEDLGYAFTDRIIAVISTVAVVTALLTVRFNMFLIFMSLPFIAALLQTYLTVLFQTLSANRIPGIVRLASGHIEKSLKIVFAIILLKICMIIALQISNLPQLPLVPAIVGFGADVLMLLYLRKQLYRMEMEKEGFSDSEIARTGYGTAALLFVPLFAFSSLLSGDRALLGPQWLLRFYRWLSSFSFRMPLREGEISTEPGQGPTPGDLAAMEAFWESKKGDFEFIRIVYKVLVYALFGAIFLLILYFVFYPFLAPLFFRKRKNPSFREYYGAMLRSALRFFKTVKSLWAAFRRKSGQTTGSEGFAAAVPDALTLRTNSSSPVKKAEIRALHKIYRKLQFRAKRHLNIGDFSSLSVGDLFDQISEVKKEWEPLCAVLAPLFNKSFFSPHRLGKEELKKIRTESARLLKEL